MINYNYAKNDVLNLFPNEKLPTSKHEHNSIYLVPILCWST